MQIFVKKLCGKTITIEVDRSETIHSLKEKIKNKCGGAVDKQRLVHGGKPLLEDQKLMDYNVQPEATLHLVYRLLGGMQLFVKTISGKTVPLDIEKGDTADDVKAKFRDKQGSGEIYQQKVEETRLIYEGKMVQDGCPLECRKVAGIPEVMYIIPGPQSK